MYRCEGYREHGSELVLAKHKRPATRIRTYTYCARQIVSHEIELQHYATWQGRRLADSRYNRLPKEPHQFFTQVWNYHLSSISTASCLPVVQVLGCWEYPCCVGLQSANGTVWTSHINSHYNQISLKISCAFFLSSYMIFCWLFDLFLSHYCSMSFLFGPCSKFLHAPYRSFFLFWGMDVVSALVYMCIFYPHRMIEGKSYWMQFTESKGSLVHIWLDGLIF